MQREGRGGAFLLSSTFPEQAPRGTSPATHRGIKRRVPVQTEEPSQSSSRARAQGTHESRHVTRDPAGAGKEQAR